MEFEIIEGVKHQVGSDGHRDACARRDAAKVKLEAEMATLRKDAADAKERADKADATLKKVTEEFKAALSPERLDAAVKVRSEVIAKASEILADEIKAKTFNLDGKSNREIKRACVVKVYGNDLRLDGANAAHEINGLWKGLVAKKAEARTDAAKDLLRSTLPFPTSVREPAAPAKGARTLDQVRADSIAEGQARSKRPLAMSRQGGSGMTKGSRSQGAQLETME